MAIHRSRDGRVDTFVNATGWASRALFAVAILLIALWVLLPLAHRLATGTPPAPEPPRVVQTQP